jgi:hypothetical protein
MPINATARIRDGQKTLNFFRFAASRRFHFDGPANRRVGREPVVSPQAAGISAGEMSSVTMLATARGASSGDATTAISAFSSPLSAAG